MAIITEEQSRILEANHQKLKELSIANTAPPPPRRSRRCSLSSYYTIGSSDLLGDRSESRYIEHMEGFLASTIGVADIARVVERDMAEIDDLEYLEYLDNKPVAWARGLNLQVQLGLLEHILALLLFGGSTDEVTLREHTWVTNIDGHLFRPLSPFDWYSRMAEKVIKAFRPQIVSNLAHRAERRYYCRAQSPLTDRYTVSGGSASIEYALLSTTVTGMLSDLAIIPRTDWYWEDALSQVLDMQEPSTADGAAHEWQP